MTHEYPRLHHRGREYWPVPVPIGLWGSENTTWFRETLALAPNAEAYTNMTTNASLALLFNLLFALAVVTTGPDVTSCGCMLTVAGSLLTDTVLHGTATPSRACSSLGPR